MLRGLVLSIPVSLLSVALAGCTAGELRAQSPDARPLGNDLRSFHAPKNPSDSTASSQCPEEPTDLLTLREALALALMRNPELASFAWEVRAAEARVLQAGLRPNPEIGFSLEDFAGSGVRAGLNAAELALELSQVIELGGQRMKRAQVAHWEHDLSAWDYEAKRLEIYTLTAQAYVELLAAERRRDLARETSSLAERVCEVVGERVRAGKVAAVEETKATVELTTRRVAVQRAEREVRMARHELAALWGNTEPTFTRVDGDLARVHPPPSFESLVHYLAQNPDLARWAAEVALRRAVVSVEKSKATPALTVGAGVKHSEESSDRSGILGFSIPLPIFDRNQGGVLEARIRLAKSDEERRTVEVRVKTELYRTWQVLVQGYAEAATLQEQALPAAMRAFESAQEGYSQGKWGYLEVLDAQRTLFETRGQWIDALSNYHRALAEAERLIGQNLGLAMGSPVAVN